MKDKVAVFVHGILMNGSKKAKMYGFKRIFRGHSTLIKEEDSYVEGEIRFMDEEDLEICDRIEGFNKDNLEASFYVRLKGKAVDNSGKEYDVWFYTQRQDYLRDGSPD